MPLPSTDESESLMICLQYASRLPFNHYINASKTFQKRALEVFQLSSAFYVACLACCLQCSYINKEYMMDWFTFSCCNLQDYNIGVLASFIRLGDSSGWGGLNLMER
jgi:hypothetical protein